MSGIPAIAAAQSRIASIESRLGMTAERARAAGAAFDAVLATHSSSTASAVAGAPSGIAGSTATSLLERLSAGTGTGALAGVPFADLFERAGAAHGVDPALLAAVASAESGFDPSAVSHAGAQGLMQLMPGTARGLGVTDAFDPEQAIDGAARLLAGHLESFGSTDLALAAYNAGPGAVRKAGGIPPYAETQAYVPKVLARYQELRR